MGKMSANQKASLRGKGGPDCLDVQSIMSAIYNEFRVSAEITVYQDLAGDLLVECSGSVALPGQQRQYFSTLRRFTPGGETLPALMMQAAHDLFHTIDRYVLRKGTGGPPSLPSGR